MLNPLFCVTSHDLFRSIGADRGQIDSRARPFRPHRSLRRHPGRRAARGRRRRHRPGCVKREVAACQLVESCAFAVQRLEQAGAFGLAGAELGGGRRRGGQPSRKEDLEREPRAQRKPTRVQLSQARHVVNLASMRSLYVTNGRVGGGLRPKLVKSAAVSFLAKTTASG
jgi:hypothetical protein